MIEGGAEAGRAGVKAVGVGGGGGFSLSCFTGAVVLAARLAVAEAELLPEVVRAVAEAELLPEVVLAVGALLPGPTFFRLSSGFILTVEGVVAGLLEAVGLDKPGLDLVLEA